MKRFSVPCDFGGKKAPFNIYIGEPNPKNHPLQHQASWLSSERGGNIPQDVMDSFEKLWKIAQENNVSFEDLCVYAMGAAADKKAAETQAAQPPAEAPPAETSSSGGNAPAALTHDATPTVAAAAPQPAPVQFGAPQPHTESSDSQGGAASAA